MIPRISRRTLFAASPFELASCVSGGDYFCSGTGWSDPRYDGLSNLRKPYVRGLDPRRLGLVRFKYVSVDTHWRTS